MTGLKQNCKESTGKRYEGGRRVIMELSYVSDVVDIDKLNVAYHEGCDCDGEDCDCDRGS